MAYNQKNNPFKKISSSPVMVRKSPFFSTETPVETEGESLELSEAEKSRARVAKVTEATERLREIKKDLSLGKDSTKDRGFIQDADGKDKGRSIQKIMNLPKEDVDSFQQDIVDIARPFTGDTSRTDLMKNIYNLDLSEFKKYITKAYISVSDISNIISERLDNMPDKDKDGTPDFFEFSGSRFLMNQIIARKLKALK